jgi:hypothetical protein
MVRKQRQCPYCRAIVLDHRMNRHLRSCPGLEPDARDPRKKRPRTRRRPAEAAAEAGEQQPIEHLKRVALPSSAKNVGSSEGLRIESKRGVRVPGERECSSCGKRVLVTFRYSKSNRGIVHLCEACRIRTHPGILDRLVSRPLQGGDFRPK